MTDRSELKYKETAGLIKIAAIRSYKDATVLIQNIGDRAFQYIVYWQGNFYTDFNVMEPDESEKDRDLSEKERQESFELIIAMAESTIDVLRGEEVTGSEAERSQALIDTMAKTDKVLN